MVSSVPTNNTCQVLYSTGSSANISTKLLLPVKGSSPCPSLQPGDYVFIRTRVRDLRGDVYLPGVVRGLPNNPRVGGALFSASIFGGRIVTCSRSSLVKIGRERYRESCDSLVCWLKEREQSPERGVAYSSSRLPPVTIPGFHDEGIPNDSCSPGHYKSHQVLSSCPTDAPAVAPPTCYGPVMIDKGTSPSPVSDPVLSRSVERFDKGTSPSYPILCNVETNTEVLQEAVPLDASTMTDPEEEVEEKKEVGTAKDEMSRADEDNLPIDESAGELTLDMLDSAHGSTLLDPALDEQVLARWMDDGWYYRSKPSRLAITSLTSFFNRYYHWQR